MGSSLTGFESIRGAKLILWDFDGVVKDSVDVKSKAFAKLFGRYGRDISEKICAHHEANGGMSRFDKMPLYLLWVGEEPSKERVTYFCQRFSDLTLQGVIDAPWVPGAEAYLRMNPHRQTFVLTSATPHDELEQILQALHLRDCFAAVYGAPTSKKNACFMTLHKHGMNPKDCLMIGDSLADLEAAQASQVPFLLRRHASNAGLFLDYAGILVKDFEEL